MTRRCSGFTLAETIVAGGLFLLLLGFFVPIMRICWRAWQRGDDLQTAQRDTLALSFRLRKDYSSSKPESLAVQRIGSSVVLSFLSYESVQGSETMWNEKGEIFWRKWVQYSFEAPKHRVLRKEVALPVPASEPDPTVPVWNSDKATLLAGHVQQFQVSCATGEVRLVVQVLAEQGTAASATQISALPGVYALDTLGY